MDLPCPVHSTNWIYTRHADTAGNTNKAIFPLQTGGDNAQNVFWWGLKKESTTGDIYLCYQARDAGGVEDNEILRTWMDVNPSNDGFANGAIDHTANGTDRKYDEVDVRFQLWF